MDAPASAPPRSGPDSEPPAAHHMSLPLSAPDAAPAANDITRASPSQRSLPLASAAARTSSSESAAARSDTPLSGASPTSESSQPLAQRSAECAASAGASPPSAALDPPVALHLARVAPAADAATSRRSAAAAFHGAAALCASAAVFDSRARSRSAEGMRSAVLRLVHLPPASPRERSETLGSAVDAVEALASIALLLPGKAAEGQDARERPPQCAALSVCALAGGHVVVAALCEGGATEAAPDAARAALPESVAPPPRKRLKVDPGGASQLSRVAATGEQPRLAADAQAAAQAVYAWAVPPLGGAAAPSCSGVRVAAPCGERITGLQALALPREGTPLALQRQDLTHLISCAASDAALTCRRSAVCRLHERLHPAGVASGRCPGSHRTGQRAAAASSARYPARCAST